MEISENTLTAFQGLVNDASQESPRPGKRVKIMQGKHQGKIGLVFWHGKDSFSNAGRYDSNWLVTTLREAMGRIGYRIGVQDEKTGEKFFTKAEYAMVEIS